MAEIAPGRDRNERSRRGCRCGLVGLLFALASGAMTGTATAQPPAAVVPASSSDAQVRVGLENRLELALADAIEAALQHNLDIRIEKYALDLDALRIAAVRGAYDPRIGFSVGETSTSTPTSSVLQGGGLEAETAASRTFGPTVTQQLPTGGHVSANFSTSRASTSNLFSFVNPVFSAGLTIEARQPLLRGLFSNPIRRELRILNLQSGITDAEFRRAVAEIVLRVQDQYWNLVYTVEAHEARVESRDLAVRQREQISQKVQAGLLTPVALTSANAEVALREQEVLQAEVLLVAAQNGLKRLLAGGPAAAIWRERIVPVDRPALHDPPLTLDEALQQALASRPELAGLDLQLEQQRVNRRFLSWETKPDVSVSASFSSIGRAGQVFMPVFAPGGGITPIGRVPDPSHPGFGGYREAWDQVLHSTFPNWSVRLDVEMPLFNRTAHAELAQADVTRRQLESRRSQLQQQIMADVADAYETVQLQRKMLDVARQARELSQEQLEGETARFEVGFTTNFEVLRYQRDLDEARVRELRAHLDYQIALARLQKAMGISLDVHHLALARGSK